MYSSLTERMQIVVAEICRDLIQVLSIFRKLHDTLFAIFKFNTISNNSFSQFIDSLRPQFFPFELFRRWCHGKRRNKSRTIFWQIKAKNRMLSFADEFFFYNQKSEIPFRCRQGFWIFGCQRGRDFVFQRDFFGRKMNNIPFEISVKF